MKLFARAAIGLLANTLGLLAADRVISGFELGPTTRDLLVAAALLTALNVFVRPLLRFVFTPFIILTFGFLTFFINAALLFALDFFLESITIMGIRPLLWGTLLIGSINMIIHFLARRNR